MTGQPVTSRREFLRGRPLGDTIAERVDELSGKAAAVPRVSDSDSVITVSRRAMACQFQVMLPAICSDAVATATAALDLIDQLEEQMTVYRDSSAVSQINALAAVVPMEVEERLFELFGIAKRLTSQTGGAFDMAAGALVKCWGFFRGPKRLPSEAELEQAMRCTGSQHVTLNAERRTIALGRPGVELNLGAIGKGYALDRAAELLGGGGGNTTAALVHGGRSSVVAVGSPWAHDLGWTVGITHPTRPDERIATVRLCDCALGTSAATFQFFEAHGRRFGHILDPRTGWPTEGHTCVSVVAPTAAQADALSTALFIMGPEQARSYVAANPEIGAVLVTVGHHSHGLEVDRLGRAANLVTIV